MPDEETNIAETASEVEEQPAETGSEATEQAAEAELFGEEKEPEKDGEAPEGGEAAGEQPETVDVFEFLKENGIEVNDADTLLKVLKDSKSYSTKVSQENAKLRAELNQPWKPKTVIPQRTEVEKAQLAAEYNEDPEGTLRKMVRQEASAMMKQQQEFASLCDETGNMAVEGLQDTDEYAALAEGGGLAEYGEEIWSELNKAINSDKFENAKFSGITPELVEQNGYTPQMIADYKKGVYLDELHKIMGKYAMKAAKSAENKGRRDAKKLAVHKTKLATIMPGPSGKPPGGNGKLSDGERAYKEIFG